MVPNRGLSGFYEKKLALLGRRACFILLEVFCGPKICQVLSATTKKGRKCTLQLLCPQCKILATRLILDE